MSEWNASSDRPDAVLFDLGNTLVSYYKAADFEPVLERSVAAAAAALREHFAVDGDRHARFDVAAAYERAKACNVERADHRVWPLAERLLRVFALDAPLPPAVAGRLVQCFLEPVFATGKIDSEAIRVLHGIRSLGLKSAIVSNTPWGSPAAPWRAELARRGLLDQVDVAVFCVDVGWRKPAPQPFGSALRQLGVAPARAWFVGDDPRWDIDGARAAGLTPVLLGTEPASGCRTVARLADLLPLLSRGAPGAKP